MGVGKMSEQIRPRTAKQHEDAEIAAATRLTQDMERGHVEYNSDGSIQSFDLEGLWRLGKLYSQTSLVPEHYRGKPADCAIAVQMAQRCRVDPMAFMQSSYIVHGRPGIETKFAVAMLNRSGLIKGPIAHDEFEHNGKKAMRCRVVCARTGEEIIGPAVTWDMVQSENWDKPRGTQKSKWQTMPEMMLRYRSSIFLIRQYFPEVLLGMMTTDELEDIDIAETAQDSIDNGKGTELRKSYSKLASLAQTEPPPELTPDESAAEDAAETVQEQTPPKSTRQCLECGCDVAAGGPEICAECSAKLEAQSSGKMF